MQEQTRDQVPDLTVFPKQTESRNDKFFFS